MKGAVGFTDINILASGLGIHGPELSAGKRSAEREQAAGEPNEQEPSGRRQQLKDMPRGHEDAGADHRSDDQEGCIQQVETPEEMSLLSI